jgi:alcohol dehydrogenase class IV
MQTQLFPFRLPPMVLAGVGAIEKIGDEVRRLGGIRPLLITDRGLRLAGLADKVVELLAQSDLKAGVFDAVEAEPSFENLDLSLAAVRDGGHDLVIGLGGGSAMDVAKTTAVLATNGGDPRSYVGVDLVKKAGLPIIQIPTTAGTGAEVTWNAIFTDKKDQLKKGLVSPYLLANSAIVDPSLTLSTPAGVTAASGMDALTHAIESYTAMKATPHTDAYALEGIRRMSGCLRTAYCNGRDLDARTDALLGSFFAGVSLANAGVGAVHALAYPLGGQFGVPHGLANALLLPYVMEVNYLAGLDRFATVAEAMGVPTGALTRREAAYKVVEETRRLGADVGIPARLRDIEIPESALSGMATAASTITRLLDNNPRRLNRESILGIYQAAW